MQVPASRDGHCAVCKKGLGFWFAVGASLEEGSECCGNQVLWAVHRLTYCDKRWDQETKCFPHESFTTASDKAHYASWQGKKYLKALSHFHRAGKKKDEFGTESKIRLLVQVTFSYFF